MAPLDPTAGPPERHPRGGRGWGRLAWRVGRIPLFVYLGLVAVLASFQARLIFPGASTQGRPEARVRPPGDGAELLELTTAGGDRVAALFGPALTPDGRPRADAAGRPTLLYFYGNGMNLAACLEEFAAFRRLGYNVLIPEYVGYGLSTGTPGEAGCMATADAAYEHLRGRQDIDPERIAVGGWSLGGAVAIDLAARRPVAGVFGLSTFTRLADVGAIHFRFLPVSLLLRHRFDSLAKIPRISAPILLGHGDRDDLVPIAMSHRLAAAAPGTVSHFIVPGAGHNDLYAVGGRQILAELAAFLDRIDLATKR